MKNNISIVCLALSFFFSCSSKDEAPVAQVMEVAVADEAVEEVKLMAPAPAYDKSQENRLEAKPEVSANASINKQKIIKDGSITVKSQDISASKKGFDNLLKHLNAYYETEDLQNNDQTTSYNLKIRIPSANFEKLITGIENGKDKIESKNIQTRDVTEEYVDTESRLASKRDYLKRYKEILSKAATVKDILAVEENIRTLQEEIESTAGRLNYLKDQVAFSTLNISLYKEKEFNNNYQDSFLTRVKIAIIQGWTAIVDFMIWVVGIWPYFISMFVLFFIIKRSINIRRSKKNNN